MISAEQWFAPVLNNERFPNTLRMDGDVIATDGLRIHAEAGAEDFLADDPSNDVRAKLLVIRDGESYREINDPDLWEPYEERGNTLRAHLFEDVAISAKFFDEAVAGLGRYTCAVHKDKPCASPVRFRSFDGKREAYIMPFRLESQC